MDDEIVIGVNHPANEKSKKKEKKATKKVASKIEKQKDKGSKRKNKKQMNTINRNKPKKKHNIKKFLIIITVLLLFIGGLVFLLFSSIFKVKNIELKNNSRVSEEEIEELCDLDSYRNIFWVNKANLSKKIEKNAYIESTKIHKKFPNTIVVEVKERVPRFMLQVADSYVYINSQGYLLEMSTDSIGLPIILGFKTDLSNVEVGKRLDIEDLKRIDTIIKIVESAEIHNIDGLITKIDISDEKNYTLIMETEGKTVYLGEADDLNTRMIYLSGILTREKGVQGEIFLNMNLNTEDAFFREKI